MTSTKNRRCPDCGGEMDEGFTLQTSPGGYIVSRWIKGRPQKHRWRGINTDGVECRAVETYRCLRCGLLKSYAIREIDVEDALPSGDDPHYQEFDGVQPTVLERLGGGDDVES